MTPSHIVSLQNSTRLVLNFLSTKEFEELKSCDRASYRTSNYAQFNRVELKGGNRWDDEFSNLLDIAL